MSWRVLGGAIASICTIFVFVSISASPAYATSRQDLNSIQAEMRRLEASINDAKQATASLNSELVKLEKLLRLQELEIQLSAAELAQLEERVQEMRIRLASLDESIQTRKKRTRDLLSVLPSLEYKTPIARLTENNRMFVVMFRESVGKLLSYEKTEMLALRKYLLEAEDLSAKLEADRDRLAARTDDLREKQTILSLNKNLKKDLLRRTHSEQNQRLAAYQAAKAAEAEIESIMSKVKDAAIAAPPPPQAPIRKESFIARKGKLPRPVAGPILTAFGKKYDAATSLYTFHKGISIQAAAGAEVAAVFPGKIVFSGTVNGYGQLLIIDHGDDHFTLLGQLGELMKKTGDSVNEGEMIGRATGNGVVYFEIRQRHIAVNPVPWLNES